MNGNEYKFYKKLESAIGLEYKILPQVHFDELVTPTKVSGDRIFSFRHINQKSVDFVVCDKTTVVPLVAIELDGKSHLQQKTKDRDLEVERILKEVNLPLLRFGNNDEIDIIGIRERVYETVPLKV
jgi:very-short-patch-repair endonuclease